MKQVTSKRVTPAFVVCEGPKSITRSKAPTAEGVKTHLHTFRLVILGTMHSYVQSVGAECWLLTLRTSIFFQFHPLCCISPLRLTLSLFPNEPPSLPTHSSRSLLYHSIIIIKWETFLSSAEKTRKKPRNHGKDQRRDT